LLVITPRSTRRISTQSALDRQRYTRKNRHDDDDDADDDDDDDDDDDEAVIVVSYSEDRVCKYTCMYMSI